MAATPHAILNLNPLYRDIHIAPNKPHMYGRTSPFRPEPTMNPSRFLNPAILVTLVLLLAACAPVPAPTDALTSAPALAPTAAPPTSAPAPAQASPSPTDVPPTIAPATLAPSPTDQAESTPAPTETPEPTTTEKTPTSTPEATPTPSAPTAEAKRNSNLRGGPGTNYDVVGGVKTGDNNEIIGKFVIGGYNWYKLENDGWIRGDLVEVLNADQIPTIPSAEVPVAPTPAPTPTPAPAPAPEQSPQPNPEVNDGRYVWGGWPVGEPNKISPMNLLHRGGKMGIDNMFWADGKFKSISMVTNVLGPREFQSGSEVFLIGKIISPPTVKDGYLQISIRCLDGSVENIVIDTRIDGGIVVFTQNDIGQVSFYQTYIKQIGPELFPVGSAVGFSITKGTDGPNYQLDHNSVVISD